MGFRVIKTNQKKIYIRLRKEKRQEKERRQSTPGGPPDSIRIIGLSQRCRGAPLNGL